MHDARVKDLFDALAQGGDAHRLEHLSADIARQVIDAMEVRPGQQLLDVGCGSGWATRILGKKAPGAQAVGVDLSPAMVALADEVSDWTSRARFECMAVERLDFPDGRFDHVFCVGALEHVADPEVALASIARVTRPGGRLELLVRRFAESPATEPWEATMSVPMQWLPEADWVDAVRAAGFAAEGARRLVDRRGPAGGEPFAPCPWVPDEASRDAQHAAGVLWISGVRD